MASSNNIPIKKTIRKVKEEWLDSNKGSLQILYERGWININEIDKYKMDAVTDENGNLNPELVFFYKGKT